MQDTVASQGLLVVLDSDGGRLGGAEGIDAEQVGDGAVVHGECLRDLEEADQLESVQALGAELVGVDLRQPGVDGGAAAIRPSMWANRKKPRTPCIIVLTEETRRPLPPRCRM